MPTRALPKVAQASKSKQATSPIFLSSIEPGMWPSAACLLRLLDFGSPVCNFRAAVDVQALNQKFEQLVRFDVFAITVESVLSGCKEIRS